MANLKAPPTLAKPVTSNEDNIFNVLAYFYAYREASIRSTAEDLDVSYASAQRILENHEMHPYKTKVQALKAESGIFVKHHLERRSKIYEGWDFQ